MTTRDTLERLAEIHGLGKCHICGKAKRAKGRTFCSYPHGMLPDKPVTPGSNMWSWKPSAAKEAKE